MLTHCNFTIEIRFIQFLEVLFIKMMLSKLSVRVRGIVEDEFSIRKTFNLITFNK